MKFTPKRNPRFVLCVGAVCEEYPDIPETVYHPNHVVMWDRQEQAVVLTMHGRYCQMICLELKGESGPSGLEEWMNQLSNEGLESEGIAPTI